MCQYELWVYTRCRSTTPPVPPLPPSFPQHLLSLPPDQLGMASGNGHSAALIQKTYPHTTYYRVTKCRLSPECAPPSFAYLAPPPPPSPRLMRKMIANAQSHIPTPPVQTQGPPAHSPNAEDAPSSPTASSQSGNAATAEPPLAAESAPREQQQQQPQGKTQQQQPHVPVHVRHSYCHTCFEILKEAIDGDGELCFPIGSDNWLNINGKSTGKTWMMDERAARKEIIVDLDYTTGIDWGVELEAFHPPSSSYGSGSHATELQYQHLEQGGVREGSLVQEREHLHRSQEASMSSREQSAAREVEQQRERDEREKARLASMVHASKEIEKRKARIFAENSRKRRWKGWEAWGAPYVVPSAQRVGRAGAS
ncbi:hypothetical protein DFH27DRAFT_378078 [Peziza echinospora]|nr:hypothetical protein DFH27DRAFT_378078 [Peziza echinospora]